MGRKFFVLTTLLFCFALHAMADHIKGGEIFYTCTGSSGAGYTYNITVKLYMVCNSGREFNNPTYVSFFKRGTNARVTDVLVPLGKTELRQLQNNNPCIINPPNVCSIVGFYNFSVTLPAYDEGYIITSQVIFRVDGMNNLVSGYDRLGATYIGVIPGTNTGANSPKNNSATFTGNDEVIICADNDFTYSFSATDSDGDELRYSLCAAMNGVENPGFGNDIQPPNPPPYSLVPYGPGYSGSAPLGRNIGINEGTGIISGVAPEPGIYVISVCVDEIRNGIIIATQRKDLQINVASCSIVGAKLPNPFMLCGDTKTISISNTNQSNLISNYSWKFTNASGATIYTTTNPTANYTFTDTGIYTVKLMVTASESCADSSSTKVLVYPGFKPGFSYDGICLSKPTSFFDTSTTVYGTINNWDWDFGDETSFLDASSLQNPMYTYLREGVKNVQLIVSNTKGCIDTVSGNISIFSKPPVQLAFTDTLICQPDSVQLLATGNGIFNWSPNIHITGANTATPVVDPTVTTTYYVDMDQNGCVNHDSVIVHVTDHVNLQAMNDTTICLGDPIQLHLVSDGLQYSWQPAAQLDNAQSNRPVAITNAITNYTVTAFIGHCSVSDTIVVTPIPYPVATIGADTMICFETTAQLHGSINGSSFIWSPASSLQFANTLNPLAIAKTTTTYILAAYDTKGCPKPGLDSVIVTVLPEIKAFAGNDTAVVINQPLQFNASGGDSYAWSPATGLSAFNIATPVGIYTAPTEGIRYRVITSNAAGCSDSAFVTVKVYKVLPSVFVPTGFTPNNDGRNDVLKPIAAGMQSISLFAVYNRLGQMIFSASESGKGWDGTFNGTPQNSGTYVWLVKATDYTSKPYFEKGTVTLIR